MGHHEQEMRPRQIREESTAIIRERLMTAEQRLAAFHERARKQHEDWFEDLRQARHREELRAETRMMEALQSPRWDSRLVAEHNLTWLKVQKYVGEQEDMKGVAEDLLFRMLTDRTFAIELTMVLDVWKAWSANGEMRRADFNEIKEKQEMFSHASLIISVSQSSVTAIKGSLAMDLQESIRIWKKVRLG